MRNNYPVLANSTIIMVKIFTEYLLCTNFDKCELFNAQAWMIIITLQQYKMIRI